MFLSKYGVARHIYIPVVKRAVVDFAVGADWTPAGGDVKISKDGGAAANVTNLPAAIAMGNTAYWDFSLTATEMQAAQIIVTVADSATKAVEDQSFVIETYGNASAQHVFDLSQATPAVDVTKLNGVAGSAANLEKSASVIYRGSVTGAATTTTLIDSGLTQADTDWWKGRIIIFTSGKTYQATDITAFDPATDKLTFTALTGAPSGGDTYVIV